MYAPYISWEVNSACNHKCFYCYNYWRSDKEYICESEPPYDRICQFILEQRPEYVTITGGEPLLVFENVKGCIQKFCDAGIYVRLVTNGACMTEEIARFCKAYQIQVMVSFPSSDKRVFEETTNNLFSFSKVLKGMDLLAKYKVRFSQNIVVTEKNLESLEETVAFLKKRYQIRKVFISRATKPINAGDELNEKLLSRERLRVFVKKCVELQEKYRVVIKSCGGYPFCALEDEKAFGMFAKGCGGGEQGYVISGNGDVRVCARDYVKYGNIFETDIKEIREKMKIWTKEEAIPQECRSCNMKEICRGGCHMASCLGKHEFHSLDYVATPENQPIRFEPIGETCMTRYLKKI